MGSSPLGEEAALRLLRRWRLAKSTQELYAPGVARLRRNQPVTDPTTPNEVDTALDKEFVSLRLNKKPLLSAKALLQHDSRMASPSEKVQVAVRQLLAFDTYARRGAMVTLPIGEVHAPIAHQRGGA